jgi:CubicO group peptidase (beta-lactamase class C family)
MPRMTRVRWAAILAATVGLSASTASVEAPIRRFDDRPVATERIEAEARRMMAAANVQGLAMAVIDGQVALVRAWGYRNVAANLPLQTDTIMYGASLTKFVFAYVVMAARG